MTITPLTAAADPAEPDEATRQAAVQQIVWLLTKAGPFSSPQERAENLLDVVTDGSDGTLITNAAHEHLAWSLDTLRLAREYIARLMQDEPVDCPCCGQRVQVYRRALNAGMARALILVYMQVRTGWVHIPSVAPEVGGDFAKLRHWGEHGLVQEATEKRDDGGRQGMWRITPEGEAFILEQTTVHKYVRMYNNRVLGRDGELVTIKDALGHRFNYDELMAGV